MHGWLRDQAKAVGMSRGKFLLNLLEQGQLQQLPLFAAAARPDPAPVATGGMPFTFIDLFAGIGGFRFALEALGGRSVFSSEWDAHSQKTYARWHGELPLGDIRRIAPAKIPDHNILAAGFPCQPFSIAGVSKKNSLGRSHGFQCVDQGNLFFSIAKIAEQKRPSVLLLENVKNLKSHDKGRTWAVIRDTLLDLDYEVFAKVIDASGWVPQHRERFYIVGFDRRIFGPNPPFDFPVAPSGPRPVLRDLLLETVHPKYTLSDHLWAYLQGYAEKHRARGNGFGFGLSDPGGIARTLSARYYKDGSEILIPQSGKNPRRLTPVECQGLMGFPEREIVVSDTQAYRQFGNAVVPKVVQAVGERILRVFAWKLATDGLRFVAQEPVRKVS